MNAYIPIASTTDENEAELALTLLRGSGLPAKRQKLGSKYYVLSSKPVSAQRVLVEHGIVKLKNPLFEAAITGLGFGAGLMAAKSVFKNPLQYVCLKCGYTGSLKDVREHQRVEKHFEGVSTLKAVKKLKNPAKVSAQVHPEALESLKRYRDDLKAGHTSAAEYWRGQAGAYFTANPLFSPKPLKFGTQVLVKIGRRITPGQIQDYSKGWYKVKTPVGVLTASSSEVMLNPSGLDEIAERRYLIAEIRKHIKGPFSPQFLTTEQLRQILRRVR